MTRRRIASLALVVAAACGHHKPAPPSGAIAVPARYETTTLSYPYGDPARELAICTPGLVVVPVQGGLYLAGWNDWLRSPDPAEQPITSVDCDEAQHVFFIRDGHLMLLGNERIVPLAPLPAGDLHVAATIDGTVWIWGTTDEQVSIVLRYDRDVGLQQVAAVTVPIQAAAVVGNDALLAAMGPKLVLWKAGADPVVLATLPGDVDGVAVAPGGDLWVSVAGGIVELDAQGRATQFATGIHGALRSRGRTLFVLVADKAEVIRLRPAGQKDD